MGLDGPIMGPQMQPVSPSLRSATHFPRLSPGFLVVGPKEGRPSPHAQESRIAIARLCCVNPMPLLYHRRFVGAVALPHVRCDSAQVDGVLLHPSRGAAAMDTGLI